MSSTSTRAGEFSNGVVISPDAARVYVSSGRGGTVAVIDTLSRQVIATIGVGQRPWNMALTADGARLYVANGRSNSVSVIDTRSQSRLMDIPVGELPWGVAIH
jgi:YVTN family beta-propeller protein